MKFFTVKLISFIFLNFLYLMTTINSKKHIDTEACDGCMPQGHCELRQPFIAVVCDVLKTKKACESVNGCLWIE